MKHEIERKYRVHTSRLPRLVTQDAAHIVQGYLSYQPSVRIRRSEQGATARAWITVKGPGMIDREEYEYEIPPDDATGLLHMCHATLEKRRYIVRHEALRWEVDEFLGPHAGLWLAEIELDSVDQAFALPPWIDGEVSHDPAYTNGALARAGHVPDR